MDETQLKDEFSNLAILVNRETKRNSITPFLYPAVWNSKKIDYNDSVVDKDNPIGSILAFAGTRETIPSGWLLCNGVELEKTEYRDLFEVLDHHWGVVADNTKFKIPNLQGQFLRGVDYDTANISDPDAENRQLNGKALSREVGSWQQDAVGEHSHTFFNNHQALGDQSNSGGSNDANKRNATREWPTTNNPKHQETRPKNYYVNFIIRAQ